MKQFPIRVSDELHYKVRLKSIQTGVSVQVAVEFFLQHWADGKVEVKVPVKSKKSSVEDKPQSSSSEQVNAKPEFSSSESSMPSWIVQAQPEPPKKYVEDAYKELEDMLNNMPES